MSRHKLIEHKTINELAEAVSAQVAEILSSAIARDGDSLAFVPGGSTPKAIFPTLARAPVDWSKVTLVPGDERIAPLDSGNSNYAIVRQAFEGTRANALPLTDGCSDCEDSAAQAEQLLGSLRWPPDLVWLGLGADGHVASIFPGEAGANALICETSRAVCVRPDPLPAEAPFARVTLTLPAILSAGGIIVAATGDAKRQLLDDALAGRSDCLPVSALFREARQTIIVHWSPA